MAPAQSALRVGAHVHPFSETCPICEQPIPNAKAKEIRERAASLEKRLAEEAKARASEQLAADRAAIEAAAKARVEQAEQDKAEAVKAANDGVAAKLEGAKEEGQRLAEAALAPLLQAAEKEKADAEKAKADAEAMAAQKVATAEREKAEAVKNASDAAAAKIDEAKAEGQRLAEAGFAVRLQAAEHATADAQKAKADAEFAGAEKLALAEQAAKVRHDEDEKRLEMANAEKAEALANVKLVEAERDAAIEDRVREVREAMERDKARELAKKDSENDEKNRKLVEEMESLKRRVEQRRADELGEGAHIQLLDALKDEFPGDDIRRIRPGVSGADILHTVMRNGQECGSILWESKNSTAWRNNYVTKLIRDQTAAKADHAVLSTFRLPPGTSQVTHRDTVIIVNPARAVAIAHMIRNHLQMVHTLRLSKAERLEKMAALYDFMTSERCALLLNRIDSDVEELLDLQVAETAWHDNHRKKQALRYKSIQKARADLDIEVGAIIGGTHSIG